MQRRAYSIGLMSLRGVYTSSSEVNERLQPLQRSATGLSADSSA